MRPYSTVNRAEVVTTSSPLVFQLQVRTRAHGSLYFQVHFNLHCTDFALCKIKDIGPLMICAKGFLSKSKNLGFLGNLMF